MSQKVGDRALEASALNNIGKIYDGIGKPKEALNYYQQALPIRREVSDLVGEAMTLDDIASLLTQQDQPQLAIIFYKQSVSQYETIRENIRQLTAEEQKAYTETIADTYRNLADLLLRQDRILEAQQVLDLLKVQELDDYLRGVRGTDQPLTILKPEQEILDKYGELQQTAIELGQEFAELKIKARDGSLTASQKDRLVHLNKLQITLKSQINQFLDRKEIQDLVQQLQSQINNETINPKQLDALRDNLNTLNAAILYPFLLEDRLELIITTPTTPPLRRSIPVQREKLNDTIVKFRQALDKPTTDAKTHAYQLYQWLIEPIEADLKQSGVETIIYLPDGQLRYIPLAALYDGEKWLAQRYQINNITATSLSEWNTAPPSTPQVLAGAFADEMIIHTVQVGDQEETYSGLPFAGREVENMLTTLPNTTRLLDRDFNLAAIESEMITHNIIHFATHAAFVPRDPTQSFILLGSGERAILQGIIPDEEQAIASIENWSLNAIDLVVLSACETGVGGVFGNGEEILGLGYQFQAQGARAVIASLWKVSDGGTQALMNTFYAALQRGDLTKAEALRRAQEALITDNFEIIEDKNRGIVGVRQRVREGLEPEVINKLSHPYYWAPFILIGNGL